MVQLPIATPCLHGEGCMLGSQCHAYTSRSDKLSDNGRLSGTQLCCTACTSRKAVCPQHASACR